MTYVTKAMIEAQNAALKAELDALKANTAVSPIHHDVHVVMGHKPSDKKADDVLATALTKTSSVLVLGFDAAGNVYIDTNIDDGGDVLWLLKMSEHKMMQDVLG